MAHRGSLILVIKGVARGGALKGDQFSPFNQSTHLRNPSLLTHHTPDLSVSPSLHPPTTHLSIQFSHPHNPVLYLSLHPPSPSSICICTPSTYLPPYPHVPPAPVSLSVPLSIPSPAHHLLTDSSLFLIQPSILLATHLSTYIPDLSIVSIYPSNHRSIHLPMYFSTSPIIDLCNLPLIYPSVHLTTYVSSHLPTLSTPIPHTHPPTYVSVDISVPLRGVGPR